MSAELVMVPKAAYDWLKRNYPATCEKAGLRSIQQPESAPGAPQEAAPELLRGWKRYEKARKLSPRQWAELHARNLAGETFDDMIDALPEPSTPVPEAAAVQAVPAVGQWQDIATAPRHTEVLVWREDSGTFIAKLTTPGEVLTEFELDGAEFPEDFEEWWSDAYGWQEGSEKPTRWMSLPAEPGAALTGGDGGITS